jgi:hypothetical protein
MPCKSNALGLHLKVERFHQSVAYIFFSEKTRQAVTRAFIGIQKLSVIHLQMSHHLWLRCNNFPRIRYKFQHIVFQMPGIDEQFHANLTRQQLIYTSNHVHVRRMSTPASVHFISLHRFVLVHARKERRTARPSSCLDLDAELNRCRGSIVIVEPSRVWMRSVLSQERL